jgi:Uma2 family endonuclease
MRFYRRGRLTQGQESDGARLEPDASYSIGPKQPRPDLAIEITVTSGGINKLAIYGRSQIPEVWFWEDGTIEIYCLRAYGTYEKVSRSERDCPISTSNSSPPIPAWRTNTTPSKASPKFCDRVEAGHWAQP